MQNQDPAVVERPDLSLKPKYALRRRLKRLVHSVTRRLGFEIIPYRNTPTPSAPAAYPPDFSDEEISIIEPVKPYSMTSNLRLHGLIQATRYVVQHDIPGAFVECGVWRGGSVMAVIRTLQSLGVDDRDLFLFDTFEGMTAPDDRDVNHAGFSARHRFEELRVSDESSGWCYASLEDVQSAVYSTGYDPARLHFIKGQVEDTLPERAPDTIALLRLDTDWYASTRHELVQLYPRLVRQGVLIIDDYGHWQGARRAVDEYLDEHNLPLLLNRLDYSGRIAVKP